VSTLTLFGILWTAKAGLFWANSFSVCRMHGDFDSEHSSLEFTRVAMYNSALSIASQQSTDNQISGLQRTLSC
jgi:hypothetical protein